MAKTAENLDALMARRPDVVRLAVLMIDGIDLKGRTNVVALGISTDGVKTPLGLWEGSSENAAVATSLLTELVARGLDVEQGVLCVLDGSKALRKAVRDVLGTHAPCSGACVTRSEMSVIICPSAIMTRSRKPRAAWALSDHAEAIQRLRALADSSRGLTPEPPRRCAKDWRRPSPSPA